MTIRYKLVTQDYKTRKGKTNETTWKIGKTVTAKGAPKQPLCSDGWLHCYDSPELAAILNPVHADIENPRLLAVETHGRGLSDRGLKRGYRAMKPVREMDVPNPTPEHRVRFAISCGKAVYKNPAWNEWADKWLSGEDRTFHAAHVAACNADAAARTAAFNAANAAYAADAAHAAANAVYAANAAANAADAAARTAARTAANAAYAADAAADAAHAAANAAAYAAAKLDLVAIAKRALSE